MLAVRDGKVPQSVEHFVASSATVEGLVHRGMVRGDVVLGVEPEDLAERVAEQVYDVHEAQPTPHVDGEGPLEQHAQVCESLF